MSKADQGRGRPWPWEGAVMGKDGRGRGWPGGGDGLDHGCERPWARTGEDGDGRLGQPARGVEVASREEMRAVQL